MMTQLTKYPEDFNLNNSRHSHMIYSTSTTPAPQLITDSQHPASINIPTLQHSDIILEMKMFKEVSVEDAHQKCTE